MKLANLIVLSLCFLFSVNTAFAQKPAKLEKKANALVEKLNQKLIDKSPELALTDTQIKQVFDIYLDGQKAMMKVNKDNISGDEKKELLKSIRKEMNTNVRKNILTKDQKQALKKENDIDKN